MKKNNRVHASASKYLHLLFHDLVYNSVDYIMVHMVSCCSFTSSVTSLARLLCEKLATFVHHLDDVMLKSESVGLFESQLRVRTILVICLKHVMNHSVYLLWTRAFA